MPLYIADYLADTGHLRTIEHGAYILLIMHYWQHGGLPDSDDLLARICRMTARDWSRCRDALAGLFSHGWHHKRIDAELAIASDIISKRSAAGKAGAYARYGNRSGKRNSNGMAIAEQTHAPSPTPSPKKKKDGADAPPKSLEQQLFDRGKEVLGEAAGGLISKLLKAKDGNVALARAAIEQASTKQKPSEYIGAVVRNHDHPSDRGGLMEGIF